ncbi:lipopolysaccharide biosynthesis protein [Aeromicrobium sp. Marseille-Q0843]|uniref:Lipopolysaccharide biosynthesis protein n=1 Tax=Aeromicrobium phoceense TaxID=2754045 RepID=A0A838XAK3_9ACTN|nr:lipopolysaccharide biosynthesis protein [Aeromicrobium phoceense]MBA4607585.1 lipopolysaccharide biosynthesis protein [Aeromicrobium phoceense]
MKKSLLLLSGYAGKSATTLLILWGFARLSGAEGAGQFAYAMAVSFPVFILAELGLRNVLQTLHDTPPFRAYLWLRAGGVALAVASIGLTAVWADAFPPAAVLVPLLGMRAADSLLDICYGCLQADGRIGAVAGWMWTNTLLTVVAVAVPIAYNLAAEASIWGSFGASLVVLVPVAVWCLRTIDPTPWRPNRRDTRRVLGAGANLGVSQGVSSAMTYLPTVYLAASASTAVVGVFAVTQYVVTFGNLFLSSIQQTQLRSLRSGLASGGRERLKSLSLAVGARQVGVGLGIAVLALVAFPPLLPLVFGDEFTVSRWEFLPIALAVVALSGDYATSAPQLVLNRYRTRVGVAVAGLAAALVVAGLTYEDATLTTAGYVVLAGIAARAATGLAMVRKLL